MNLNYFLILLSFLCFTFIHAKSETQQYFFSAQQENIDDFHIDIPQEKLSSQIVNIASTLLDFDNVLIKNKEQTWIHRSRISQTNSASNRRSNNLKLNQKQTNSNKLQESQQLSSLNYQSNNDLSKIYQIVNDEISQVQPRILQSRSVNSRMGGTRSLTASNTRSVTSKSSTQSTKSTKPQILSSSRTYGGDENNDRLDSKTHQNRGGKTRSPYFSGTIRPRN